MQDISSIWTEDIIWYSVTWEIISLTESAENLYRNSKVGTALAKGEPMTGNTERQIITLKWGYQ